ncbi:type II toxin-antitoxin system RelE/ParE family toxin [Hoeflea ulvae]|uniref:Toxin n=1 Tax=Hoeflea ulvae TaxID=2983764 RepID=A0ABT3YH19_9HYPH|nr:type II toxin-antitoxin system RelE/ParE family toxin [Hoeflea ulvae]MCY0095025.1 type II toxin-antitoxin system RelE/ParE family toxin [Hoeflea ulvae]
MPYRLTRRAVSDVRGIYRYGRQQFGQNKADLYHRNLKNIFELLAANPGLARECRETDPPVRVHPFGSHMIILVEIADGSITIIRVRHQREDWTALTTAGSL